MNTKINEFEVMAPVGSRESLAAAIQAGADERRARLDELMAKLTPRERKVVKRSYAIGCEAVTVRELALEMGLSEVRVRQILTKGVNKLQIMSNL